MAEKFNPDEWEIVNLSAEGKTADPQVLSEKKIDMGEFVDVPEADLVKIRESLRPRKATLNDRLLASTAAFAGTLKQPTSGEPTTIGPLSPSAISGEEAAQKGLISKDTLKERPKLNYNIRTNVINEAIEGVGGSVFDLFPEALDIRNKDRPIGPFEDLNRLQKAAFIGGYVAGGANLSVPIISKGVMVGKAGLTKIGKVKKIMDWYGKGAENISSALVKKAIERGVPEETAALIGPLASKIIKNIPMEAAEGAIWGGLASKGDLENIIEGAVLMPALSPLVKGLTAGAEGVAKGIKTRLMPQTLTKPQAEIELTKLMSSLEERASWETVAFSTKTPEGLDDDLFMKGKSLYWAFNAARNQASQEYRAARLLREEKRLVDMLNKEEGEKSIEKLQRKLKNLKDHPDYREDVPSGILKEPEEKRTMVLFNENLEKAGLFNIQNFKVLGQDWGALGDKLRNVTNKSEKWSKVDESTGIGITNIFQELGEANFMKTHLQKSFEPLNATKAIESLKEKGTNMEEAHHMMHYVRTNPETGEISFDPSPVNLTKYKVPHFKGVPPKPEILDDLYQTRYSLDWLQKLVSASNPDAGYIPGYMGVRRKQPLLGPSRLYGEIDKGLGRRTILEQRQMGLIPAGKKNEYITDLSELYPKLVHESMNAAVYGPLTPKINTAYQMLRMMGRESVANDFLENVRKAMGYKDNQETLSFVGRHMVEQTGPHWSEFFALGEEEEIKNKSLAEDVYHLMLSAMYHSFLGVNPKLLIAQAIQPEVMGSAEIGPKYMAIGRARLAGSVLNKSDKALLGKVRPFLVPEKIEMDDKNHIQRNWVRFISNMIDLPGKPGLAAFQYIEKPNRETIFLGAHSQFLKAAEKGDYANVLESLLPGERLRILNSLSNSGKEVAAETYGLVRSKRANFIYDVADTPDFFTTPFGSMIKFVSWPSNVWMRAYGATTMASKGKAALQIGKQFAYPMAVIYALQTALNEEFYPASMPVGNVGTLRISTGVPVSALLETFDTKNSPLNPFLPAIAVTTGAGIPAVQVYKKFVRPIQEPDKYKFGYGTKKKKQTKTLTEFAKEREEQARTYGVPGVIEFKLRKELSGGKKIKLR